MEIYSAEKLKTVKLHGRVVEERLWQLGEGVLFARLPGDILRGILCLERRGSCRRGL